MQVRNVCMYVCVMISNTALARGINVERFFGVGDIRDFLFEAQKKPKQNIQPLK